MFGNKDKRIARKFKKNIRAIASLENKYSALSDSELKNASINLKSRCIEKGINDVTNDAFALVREASLRTTGMRHFDVQMIGGLILTNGAVPEMKTGEGKTLVAVLPAYLHALTGQPVHIATVNDYLAERDAETTKPILNILGMSVGVVTNNSPRDLRKSAYLADITYGTSAEFGFDYLRDNMSYSEEEMVQRGHTYCIIDEVDSILIDEARTPLIISGQSNEDPNLYLIAKEIAAEFRVTRSKDSEGKIPEEENCHAIHIEKIKRVQLTEFGYELCEDLLESRSLIANKSDLYTDSGLAWIHKIIGALNASIAYSKNTDYILRDEKVLIIDPNTGRIMDGRRWSDGIHQAVEAKENMPIQPESFTLGSISIQNYFKLYTKISGMTGTAKTEELEFMETYGLSVFPVPPNKPNARIDERDQLYMTYKAKINAVIADIKASHEKGQPVLVGTTSVAQSEHISQKLGKLSISHNVLNAKQHEREASIIANAGKVGAVTIATNMAGRGTDIILGGVNESSGSEECDNLANSQERVRECGGLRVIGTERHDSRRIDNQLRGRSGRQGDPGSSVFYLSMEDRLLRIFGADRFKGIFERIGFDETDAIQHRFVDKSISDAQNKIEGVGFDSRKELVKFDTVLDQQRSIIYSLRRDWMSSDDIFTVAQNMLRSSISGLIDSYIPENSMEEQWNLIGLEDDLALNWGMAISVIEFNDSMDVSDDLKLRKMIENEFMSSINSYIPPGSNDVVLSIVKSILLKSIDTQWQEVMSQLDQIKEGIYLRSYAQKTPIQEFQVEAQKLFSQLITNTQHDFSRQFVYSIQNLAKAYEKNAA